MENLIANALGEDVAQLAVEERRRLLSRLLARLAHEIRNPLSSLHIHLQLLEEDIHQLDAGVRDKLGDRLQIVHGEVHRLETIVKHFLRLSGPSELNLERVKISELMQQLYELLRPEARNRGIDLQLQCPDGLPEVLADRVQLTQALLNLVINAFQAIEGAGRVECSVEQVGEALAFHVRDSGPGVPPDKLLAIFEPYYSTKPDGTGLGLWIVQQIALAHAGDVKACNLSQGGALFTVRIPLAHPPKTSG